MQSSLRFGLAIAATLAAVPAHAQYAIVTIQGHPSDVTGAGPDYSFLFTPENTLGQFGVQSNDSALAPGQGGANSAPLPSGLPTTVNFSFAGGQPQVSSFDPLAPDELSFTTSAQDAPLLPGTYTDAQRAGFAAAGHPGLFVALAGIGPNAPTGSFTITNFTYVPDPKFANAFDVQTFDASFVQVDSNYGTESGTITYRATGSPPAVPEAPSAALLTFGLPTVGLVIRRRMTRRA